MDKNDGAASLVRSDALLVRPFEFPSLPRHKTIMGITIIENPLFPADTAMLTDGKTGVILRSTNIPICLKTPPLYPIRKGRRC